MRASVLLTSAMALAIGASSASAMDANEIFNRLKAQAGATTTVQGGGATRGLSVSYGDEEETTAAKPSVVSVPAAQPKPSTVAATAPASVQPTTSSVTATAIPSPVPAATPVSAVASVPAIASIPEAAPVTTVTSIEPSTVTTVSAPTISVPTISSIPVAPAEPTYVSTEPTYEAIESPVVQAPVVQSAAVRIDPASYSSVDTSQRIDLRIFFEWNSASLKPEAIGQLAELCTAIQRVGASPDNRFKIIGHTDKSGSDQYNLYLSNARAREVKRHLVEECALPPNALIAVGEGERQSPSNTPSNSPEERRVEIQFVS